jgi:hypothetical protein
VAPDFDFDAYSDEDLLRLWKRIPEVLRGRGVCRTKNVVSDVAERLVADKLGLTLAPNSTRDYDATDAEGKRYQVKARMLSTWNGSTQLGDIHHLNEPSPFDFLAVGTRWVSSPCARLRLELRAYAANNRHT